MNDNDMLAATFTRVEWRIIMAALGKLPGEVMFDVAKKVEALLKEQPE